MADAFDVGIAARASLASRALAFAGRCDRGVEALRAGGEPEDGPNEVGVDVTDMARVAIGMRAWRDRSIEPLLTWDPCDEPAGLAAVEDMSEEREVAAYVAGLDVMQAMTTVMASRDRRNEFLYLDVARVAGLEEGDGTTVAELTTRRAFAGRCVVTHHRTVGASPPRCRGTAAGAGRTGRSRTVTDPTWGQVFEMVGDCLRDAGLDVSAGGHAQWVAWIHVRPGDASGVTRLQPGGLR